MTSWRASWVSLVAVGLLLVAACGTSDDSGQAAWVDPAWMARIRMELDEYQTAMSVCLEEQGVEPLVTIGGLVVSFTYVEEGDELPDWWEDFQNAALDSCLELVPEPAVWRSPRDAEAFQRELDVRDCLVYHGIEISEPPTFEVWVEQDLPWNPYADIWEWNMPTVELAELFERCPQGGMIPIGIMP
jgi:hypothetical protein